MTLPAAIVLSVVLQSTSYLRLFIVVAALEMLGGWHAFAALLRPGGMPSPRGGVGMFIASSMLTRHAPRKHATREFRLLQFPLDYGPLPLVVNAVTSPENIPQSQPQETDALRRLLAAEKIELTDDQIELLDRYRRLLWSWNERMNLTRHTTLDKFVGRDVIDSFQVAQLLKPAERVLDVGSGGGVPGVLLAILRPDLSMSLSESTQKKARALESIVAELGLGVPVYATRAEEVLEISTFDTLVARGLAALPKVLIWFAPHWDAFDQLLLIKGPSWVDERNAARHQGLLRGLELRKAATYQSPVTGAESVILKIWRAE